ncbi:MAG: hypothetical protein HQL75_05125 [Magnetococcales bacterium]|nr:hypothetical protein [Magnetococcales bacterium]
MTSIKKIPRQKTHPDRKKSSRSACSDCREWVDFSPSWVISTLDMDGPFGWNRLEKEVFDNIIRKLQNFESMTWGEIEGRRHHSIGKDTLSRKAQKRLEEIHMDDVDEVFSLAMGGIERIFGIRERNIFKILWWDPDHQVCPSSKKHT